MHIPSTISLTWSLACYLIFFIHLLNSSFLTFTNAYCIWSSPVLIIHTLSCYLPLLLIIIPLRLPFIFLLSFHINTDLKYHSKNSEFILIKHIFWIPLMWQFHDNSDQNTDNAENVSPWGIAQDNSKDIPINQKMQQFHDNTDQR